MNAQNVYEVYELAVSNELEQELNNNNFVLNNRYTKLRFYFNIRQ